MNRLDISTVCNRVALQSPYFAFTDLKRKSKHAVQGSFHAEHERGPERGPIAAAELVRHLATLGSCAAIIGSDAPPTFYLGTKGRLRVMREASPDEAEPKFNALAEVLNQDRKSLIAQTMVSSGRYLAHFHCEYQTLPEAVFARTFRHYRTPPAASPSTSPYREAIELEFEPPRERSLVAHSLPLPENRFAGHFPDYPAWPASIYGESISRVSGKLLNHMRGEDVTFNVVRMDIDALRLISAAQTVSFHVDCVSASPLLSHYIFQSEVRSGDVLAATIELEVYI
ncbi:hypothetical protein H7Q97_03900 [Ochrobactrum sp. CM-21-5]|nr:hypothetical protein [Ochrobactrum sp. CM-21-5]MBC2884545.1 hypothetical protein [Ochrobactrum sp. CM-21-5]